MKTESTDLKPNETNDTGAPTLHRRENSPDHSIRADGPVGQGGDASATIHDRTGLYIAIIALLVAGMGLGFEISRAMSTSELRELQNQSIDAKIAAGAAGAEATARAADTNARVAVDEIERMRTALAAKNIIIPKGHD
jgi:hypothetical protein